MGGFQWLNDAARWFGKLIPRLTIIPLTHRGVLFGPRGGVREKGPGACLWWPVAQVLVRVPVVIHAMSVASRSLPLPQGRDAMIPRVAVVGLAVQYRVSDAVLAATATTNMHALVENYCQAATGTSWKGSLDTAAECLEEAREIVTRKLAAVGIEVLELEITHLGETVAILLMSGDYGNDANAESPGMLKPEE